MGEKGLTKNTYAGKEVDTAPDTTRVVTKNTYDEKLRGDDSDTIHVIIKNPETAQDDLAFLAKKMGLDIDKIRQERLDLEKQERLKIARERVDHKRQMQEQHVASMIKEFFQRQNETIFIFLNGKRLTVKSFERIGCPHLGCSYSIGAAVKGRVLDLMDTDPYVALRLLAPVHGIVAILDLIHCDSPTPEGRHNCELRVQQIAPNCAP